VGSNYKYNVMGFPDRNSRTLFERHAYGRRQGRGNRYAHEYDDIMLDYMVAEQLKFDESNVDPMWGHRKPYSFKRHSRSALAKALREHVKSVVSWDTIIYHLDCLKAERIIEEDPRRGSNNDVLYHLKQIRLRSRMMNTCIAKRLILRDGTIVESITDNVCWTRPPSYYLHYFHPFPWSKIDVPASCLGLL
jgi:hypothetical protein